MPRYYAGPQNAEVRLGHGHAAAMEEPELLAADFRTWFRGFRAELDN